MADITWASDRRWPRKLPRLHSWLGRRIWAQAPRAGQRVQRQSESRNSFTFSLDNVEGISGVQTGPGATALTRTPRLIARLASERVKLTMAALVDAYAIRLGLGSKDWIEPVLIIDPPFFICGSSALHSRNMAKIFTRNVSSNSSSGISSNLS